MEITWYGHACFRITERNMATVIADPYDSRVVGFEPLKLKADICTLSTDLAGHNFASAVKGDPHLIFGPGEYEIGSVFVTGIQTNGHSRKDDDPRNTLYVFNYNGICVAHLGNINRVPTQTEIEELGPVHIAMVPVGDGSSLNAAKAAEVISLLEPNIVLPMHYAMPESPEILDPLSKFLKEMGVTPGDPLPSLKVTSISSLPEETQVVVLSCQKS